MHAGRFKIAHHDQKVTFLLARVHQPSGACGDMTTSLATTSHYASKWGCLTVMGVPTRSFETSGKLGNKAPEWVLENGIAAIGRQMAMSVVIGNSTSALAARVSSYHR